MTHALVNPVETDAVNSPVACNSLQRHEELLDSAEMGVTQGGIAFVPFIILGAKVAAPYVATGVVAFVVGVAVAEVTSNNGSNGCTCRPMPRRRN